MQCDKRCPRFAGVAAILLVAGLQSAARSADPQVAAQDKETYENILGMQFVLIPAGEFLMGTPADEISRIHRTLSGGRHLDLSDETPQHRVRITKPFLLATHEVTVEQFRTFVNGTGHRTDAERSGQGGSGWNRNSRRFDSHPNFNWRNPGFTQGDDHPVVNVSWNDAREFCGWLSRLEERTYRLPTEAEWEYACRAGTATWFSNGNSAETLVTIGNITDRSARRYWGASATNWTFLNSDDGYPFTCPVGKFKPNPWGLYDMHGNVWEWCADRYGSSYYRVSPPEDPPGPAAGDERICRGGSWGSFARRCRAAYRNHGESDDSERFIGFRVALDPETP